MIEVKNLTKDYGARRAIDSLNFSVNKGDVVGFLGPNGAGKSTTMKIITGFMAPTSGQALVAGNDVFENPIEVKRHIGYLPELPPVYLDMYVQDYLKYVAELKGVAKHKISKAVDDSIGKMNLGDVRGRLIQHLSKGYKQRVGIAQAIVSDPEVLILDEPTVGLDPKQVSEIRELIKTLRGQHTIVLSTHILSEVEATCDKVIIINKGKIVAEDKIQNLAALEKGHLRVHLRTRRDSPDLKNILSSVGGVLSCQNGSSLREWDLDLKGDESLVEMISAEVVKAGYGLVELAPVQRDLEDVFLKFTYDADENRGQYE